MSYEKLLALDEKFDCIIFVPLNGRIGDGEKIKKWCTENNILFIEDSAHALGLVINPINVGLLVI